LSQFGNITDTGIYPARKNRLTLGFWVNIMNMSNVNTSGNLIHISISDYIVLSFYSTAANVISRCMVHQKTNYSAETNSSVTTHNNYFTTNPPAIRAQISTTNTFANTSGVWFYMRCGMNNDTSKYFLYGQKQATTYPAVVTESTIPMETLFRSESINVIDHFRKIYRKSDTMTIKILNASLVNSPVYIKNLYVLQEYVRETVQFQY